jgi:predicted PurR-regulated permease PerM
MIIIIALLVASLFLNGLLIYRGQNLIKEMETLQEFTDNQTAEYKTTLNNMLETMREIDIRGSFEADDEVGVVFTELKDLIESYNEESN